ncbi:MAG: ABC transporter permease [Undibacterium sp.]|uniref:ABC transporter permease n=1 Tax=Undibacterium sp. TaxID=1914977 RepID=UPI0027234F5B|nr:ABC transporter permease [Undibacterium sp.]MDO8654454.1 ABC transporter permease [Undibacterium sp.]
MKIRRIIAIARKETLQVIRDPRSLMIALLLPLMQMFMLGYGVSLDVKHIALCILDLDESPQSQELLKKFAASRYFSLHTRAHNIAETAHQIDGGSCAIGVIVPAGFSRNLTDQGAATVQVLVDGTDSNTANIAANYARLVIGGFSSDVQLKAIQRQGSQIQTLTPVGVQARVWFNEDLESRYFIIPGVVALVMAIVGAQLTSLTIAREWERGTMELLISTQVQPMELMLGKLSPYFVLGLLDATICLALAVGWFEVPFRGTLLTLFFTTSLFLIVVLCIGYYVSVSIRSQVGASQIALILTMLPTTLLSGFSFPIDQMPPLVQDVTYLVSARYYVTILKAVFLKGATVAELALPIVCLTLYAIILVVLAARAFRKTLD